jgi:translation initiation factor IF-3
MISMHELLRRTVCQVTRLSSISKPHSPIPTLAVPIRCLNYKAKKPGDQASKSSSKPTKPQTVAVTKANQHLKINLLDENSVELGVVPMEFGKKIAADKNLKLVMLDEKERPPRFQLVSGTRLAQMQMEQKAKLKAESQKSMPEKEIRVNLTISEHDLQIKLKHIKELCDRGHPIILKIESKIPAGEEIKSLQGAFKQRIMNELSYTTCANPITNDREMVFHVNRQKKSDKKASESKTTNEQTIEIKKNANTSTSKE